MTDATVRIRAVELSGIIEHSVEVVKSGKSVQIGKVRCIAVFKCPSEVVEIARRIAQDLSSLSFSPASLEEAKELERELRSALMPFISHDDLSRSRKVTFATSVMYLGASLRLTGTVVKFCVVLTLFFQEGASIEFYVTPEQGRSVAEAVVQSVVKAMSDFMTA